VAPPRVDRRRPAVVSRGDREHQRLCPGAGAGFHGLDQVRGLVQVQFVDDRPGDVRAVQHVSELAHDREVAAGGLVDDSVLQRLDVGRECRALLSQLLDRVEAEPRLVASTSDGVHLRALLAIGGG
jgi:hypothetical protein